jgi:hypothetical protein
MTHYKNNTLQIDQARQCDIRLQNDTADLEAAASERMAVDTKRFGDRITEIRVTFPQVHTAFYHRTKQVVKIRKASAIAFIYPNSGNSFPYPLGAPVVQILFPQLERGLIPWLSGLWWPGSRKIFDPNTDNLSDGFREIMEATINRFRKDGVGFPCLWREGEWNRECDLIFVVRQVHRLLTDPRDYSPSDSMNAEAALYWALHKDQLPLEPPIPEIYEKRNPNRYINQNQKTTRFSLFELE